MHSQIQFAFNWLLPIMTKMHVHEHALELIL